MFVNDLWPPTNKVTWGPQAPESAPESAEGALAPENVPNGEGERGNGREKGGRYLF